MRFENLPNGQQTIILENKVDALEVNRGYWMAMEARGTTMPAGHSIMSSPHTLGGEFPKTVDPQIAAICLNGMARITDTEIQRHLGSVE